jgi:hypothetical protein
MDAYSTPARIRIQSVTGDGYPVEIEGPGGEYSAIVPIEAETKIDILSQRMEQLLAEDASGTQVSSDTQLVLKDIGQYLFEILNADRVRNALNLSLLPPNCRLPVQLRIQENLIRAWPWELLYDEVGGGGGEFDTSFIALSPRVLLSHYHEAPIEVQRPEKLDRLRVLVIAASPRDFAALDNVVREEVEAFTLLKATTDRLDLIVLENATRDRLWFEMKKAERPFHVVHFIGHGYFEASDPNSPPETGVYLEKEDHSCDPVSADVFARALVESQEAVIRRTNPTYDLRLGVYPRLVTLNACHSARTTFSVANALVNYGLPAVIGMRFRACVSLPIFFNRGLYAHLLDGYRIDEAVALCRGELRKQFDRNDWSIPVLYLRATDGILFEFNQDSNERARWLEQLQYLTELANSRAEEAAVATKALVKLGASAIALSIAAILASPIAAVRAGAAALLRSLPRTPNTNEIIAHLVAPRLAQETEENVRREIVHTLIQLGTSDAAPYLLNALLEDHDQGVREAARAGLQNLAIQKLSGQGTEEELTSLVSQAVLTTVGNELDPVFFQIAHQIEWLSKALNQLEEIVRESLQRQNHAGTYLTRVQTALAETKTLQQTIAQARVDAPSMSADEVWNSLRHTIAAKISNANGAMIAANEAAQSTMTLTDTLHYALSEVEQTLDLELALITELDAITRELDGVEIADRLRQAIIQLVRRDIGSSDNN